MKKNKEDRLTCPSCGDKGVKKTAQVCPKCGYLVCEYFNQLYYQCSNYGQPANIQYQAPYLKPTYCKIKKLKNAMNQKSNLSFYKHSYIAINYNMLIILGKNEADKKDKNSDWLDGDDGCDEALPFFIVAIILVVGLLLLWLFNVPNNYHLVIGLRPEHIRNISFKKLKKGDSMIVEMSDGNLLEICSSYDAYNKICTWFNNNKFPQNNY